MAVSSLVVALCSLLQVSAQDIVAEPIQISAVASSNQTVDFPRVHGQNGDLLTVSLSDSCSLLKYGQLPVESLSNFPYALDVCYEEHCTGSDCLKG